MTFPNAARLVRDFESCILPCPEWTHEARLVVGLWYARACEPAAALEKMRVGLNAYNRACGAPVQEDVPRQRGYHETLTRFYIAVLCDFWEDFAAARSVQTDASFEQALALLLAHPIADKNYPLQFYSSDVLFSSEARCGFAPPDKAPPPRALAYF